MTDSTVIRVLIVDDHVLVRDGLREILSTTDDIEVVGEAGDQESALRVVEQEKPDVILLDVEIPGGSVQETVSEIRRVAPESQVIIVSMFDGSELVSSLIELGIRGYLLKSVSRYELLSTVRGVRGEHDRVLLSVSRASLTRSRVRTEALSDRELEVLRLAARAMSNAQIGATLFLAEATVKKHLRNIFAKLGAVSRIDAVNKAVTDGLIEAPKAGGAD
jgi:DNA-binding NarL/FixJ family response regulator